MLAIADAKNGIKGDGEAAATRLRTSTASSSRVSTQSQSRNAEKRAATFPSRDTRGLPPHGACTDQARLPPMMMMTAREKPTMTNPWVVANRSGGDGGGAGGLTGGNGGKGSGGRHGGDCGGGSATLGPQSVQSVPKPQLMYSAPGPPSPQTPFEAPPKQSSVQRI